MISSVPNVYYTEDGSAPTTNSASVTLAPVGTNYVGTFQWCNAQIDLSGLQIIAVSGGVSTPLTPLSSTTNILGFVRGPSEGIGGTAVIPIVLDLRSNASIETMQFVVEVTPVGAAPALGPLTLLPISANDFVQLIGPSSGNAPVALSTIQEVNTNTPNGQALLVYTEGTGTGLSIQGYGVVGLLEFQIPVTANVSDQYNLNILYPSGTAAADRLAFPSEPWSARI